ncbi:ATPase family AAA domain-containing protein 5-like [Lineus longissimus]|uniref:ATPase family AAA domain-containing protein 5-like n=1 Tax=Lineus longissimus TaxID=88925 RepID=UPI002B4F1A3B
MPGILTESRNCCTHSDVKMEGEPVETEKDVGMEMASPKITDYFQKTQLTSPKPAKGLLAFFSPAKGKLKEGAEVKDQDSASSCGQSDNSFTKIRPTKSSGTEGRVVSENSKPKGKKRKPEEETRSDPKKRRKENIADNSLDDFEVHEDTSNQGKGVNGSKKTKSVKKLNKKDLIKVNGSEQNGEVIEGSDGNVEGFGCPEGESSEVAKSRVVKLPSLEQKEAVDDSVVSMSYWEFISDMIDGKENENDVEDTKSDCVDKKAKDTNTDGGKADSEISGTDVKVERQVVTISEESVEPTISEEKGAKNVPENCSKDSGDDFVDANVKTKVNSSKDVGVSRGGEKDIVDGDSTKLKCRKPQERKKVAAEDSTSEASTEQKEQKGNKKKLGATKIDESMAGDDEPKKSVGIAKFFVKKDSESVVKADVHSSQSSCPEIVSVTERRRSSSNVVVNSSDSDTIQELGTFALTPGKGCESDDEVQSPIEVKYPDFFFGKKSGKKAQETKGPEVEEKHMEVENVQPEKQTSEECSAQEVEMTSAVPSKPAEEILIDDSNEGESPPVFTSPSVPAGKKAKQMTFNFTGGNFRMEKAEKDENTSVVTAGSSTSDNESNTEVVEEVVEVKAKKKLSGFFTSTPNVTNAKKKGAKVVKLEKGGKRRKEKECEESTEEDEEEVACRKGQAKKKPAGRKGKMKRKETTGKGKTVPKAETPGAAKKGKRKRVAESPELIAMPVAKRERPRRALRGVYRATMLDEVKSPLRMKLTRTGTKSSTSTSTDETPLRTRQSTRSAVKSNESKMTAAQYLLQKAKENKAQKISDKKGKGTSSKTKIPATRLKNSGKGVKPTAKTKRKSDEENRKPGKMRRMSKNSDVSVVVLDDGDDGEKKGMKKGVKKGVTPRKKAALKSPWKGTPKKKGKVAPMFMSKKDKEAAAAEESKDVEVIETPEMIEYRRVREAIVKSGISDDIRQRLKQTEEVSTVSFDWPPLPDRHSNHVLQKSVETGGSDVWNLPSQSISVKAVTPQVDKTCPSFAFPFEKSLQSSVRMPEVIRPEPFSPEIVQGLLAEVRDNNPGFPVRKMYKSLVARKQTSEEEVVEIVGAGQGEVTIISDSLPKIAQRDERKLSDDSVILIDEINEKKVSDTKKGGKKKGQKRRSGRLSRGKSMDEAPEEMDVGEKEAKDTKVESCDNGVQGIDTDKKDEKSTKNLAWTDMYQPRSALDIIGNSNSVKKLKNWLTEWKERVDREARKQKILERKEARKNKNKKGIESNSKWLMDDESDFELSDMSDNDYEDDNITNTMLLTGPHGIGKTATVYALAHELGYKVFEVNSSSRRNGKQVMSQLLEATQSHHVSKANLGGGTPTTPSKPNPFAAKTVSVPEPVDDKSLSKAPTNFFNMFNNKPVESAATKKTGEVDQPKKKGAKLPATPEATKKRGRKKAEVTEKMEVKVTPKKPGRKRRADLIEEVSSEKSSSRKESKSKTPKSKGKKEVKEEVTEVKKPVASISLILFEEVDIVFEDDKGFILAIQSLMSMTKRPMIMTTADPRVACQFEGFFEELFYKKPSVVSVASYLQVLCLVESIRTDHRDVLSVVNACNGDVRQSLLLLQFWIVSGGGKEKSEKLLKMVLKKSDDLKRDSQESEPKEATHERMKLLENKIDSEDEFETFTRRKGRRVVPQIDSDSSMDSCSLTPKKTKRLKLGRKMDAIHEDSQSTQINVIDDSRLGEEVYTEIQGPAVHVGFYGSTIGPSALVTEESQIQKCLQEKPKDSTSFQKQVDLVMHYNQRHDSDLITNNLRHLLPLPRLVAPSPYHQVLSELKSTRKRFSRIRADWYDSEDSQDGFESLQKQKDNVEDNVDKTQEEAKKMDVFEDTTPKKSLTVLHASVKALSKYYDDVSFMDVVGRRREVHSGHCGNEFYLNCGNIIPGLGDEFSKFDPKDSESGDVFDSSLTFTLLSSLHCCCDTLTKVMGKTDLSDSQETLLEKMTLPVQDDVLSVRRHCDFVRNYRHSSVKKCAETVSRNLPVSVQGQTLAISTDYLPAIRTICKAEESKEAAKIKRRFFHYMDSISFHLKPSVLETLNNSFR